MKKLRIILQSNYFYLFLMLFVAILLYFNACDKSKYDINDDVIIGTITSYYIDTDKLVITIFGKEKVLCNYYFKDENNTFDYELGDKIKLFGKLKLPSNNSIFNGFNYREYLKYERINYIFDIDEIIKISNNKSIMYKLKNSIINIGYATYLSDLVFQVVKQTNAHSEIFDLFINALIKINENYDALVITNIIELKLLNYLGVSPILDRCSVCDNVTNIATLSAFKHGLLCKKCVTNERIVDMRTIKFIRMYYYLDISKISKIDMDNKVKNEIDDFLNEYYSSYTGLYLNSKKFIDDLKKINVYV